jgi:hypothetical protein
MILHAIKINIFYFYCYKNKNSKMGGLNFIKKIKRKWFIVLFNIYNIKILNKY